MKLLHGRNFSLHGKLVLLYSVMALVPILLAGGFLINYLGDQVKRSDQRYQRQALKLLSSNYRTMEQTSNNVLQSSMQDVQAKQASLLSGSTTLLIEQQQKALDASFNDSFKQLSRSFSDLQANNRHDFANALIYLRNSLTKAENRTHAQLSQDATTATRAAVTELVSSSTLLLTENTSKQVEQFLRNTTAMLTLIAQQPAIQSANELESRWIMEALQNREPIYRQLCLLDEQGNPHVLVEDTEVLSTLAEPFYKTAVERARQGEAFIGQEVIFLKDSNRQKPLLSVSVPVKVRGASVIGTIFALVSLDDVIALVRDLHFGQSGYTLLCTMDGDIISHHDLQKIGTKERDFSPFVSAQLARGQKHAGEVKLASGLDYLVCAVPLRRQGWMLISAQPVAEAYALANTLTKRLSRAQEASKITMSNAVKQSAQKAEEGIKRKIQTFQAKLLQQRENILSHVKGQTQKNVQKITNKQLQEATKLLQRETQTTVGSIQRQIAEERKRNYEKAMADFAPIAGSVRQSMEERVYGAALQALCFVVVTALLGGLLIVHTIVKPLRRLSSATQAIAKGDFSQRVAVPKGRDEIQDLALSFNRMAEALEHSRNELNYTQAQLVQSSKLASLGTLASGVAHELNQPLAIIRAIAQQNLNIAEESNRQQFSSNALEMLKEDLQMIERQTSRMSQIILHLRTFARKSAQEMEQVNLNEVAQNALILLREQLRQRGIELIERYDEHLPDVMGDANALEQVLINLLTNARDALEEAPDAHVILTSRQVEENGQGWAEIRIADNGSGIPDEIKSQIFDPFFTTKEPGKGTGLGLSISFEIVQRHQGVLSVQSELRRGTVFTLRVPAVQARQEAA